jgi:hypothetical protein
MTFANAAARDAMLVSDLAPVEGMRVFMLDTNLLLTYIVVSSVGYWAPQPGTLIFNHYQQFAQSLGGGTVNSTVGITSISAAPNGSRNFGGWFNTSTGRFLPLCPGYYEFYGTASQTYNTGGANLRAGFRSDTSAYYPNMIPQSEGRWLMAPGLGSQNLGGVTPCRKYQQYMNGTTNFMELCLYQQGVQTTITAAGYQCHFGAKYLGM